MGSVDLLVRHCACAHAQNLLTISHLVSERAFNKDGHPWLRARLGLPPYPSFPLSP